MIDKDKIIELIQGALVKARDEDESIDGIELVEGDAIDIAITLDDGTQFGICVLNADEM